MSYGFHAAAPPGAWINDPNALFFRDGRYHLFVQHAADAPDFRRIGWGHCSSPDLLDWRWDGVVVPPEPDNAAYSGSIVMGEPPTLFFTRHRPDGPWQTQARAALAADGLTASVLGAPLGPAGRNVRDPFVWRAGEAWRMLVAYPCDWTDWRGDPPSTVALWGSPDGADWSPLATIGPWSPPGVMWEVPALIDFGATQALILSLVDRRADVADCTVRYWLGRLTDDGFAPAADFPRNRVALDGGPDFYAAIPNAAAGWPGGERLIVAWASSWRTAHGFPWPETRGGGPITLPRRVTLAGDRVRLDPGVARAPDWRELLPDGETLTIARDGGTLTVTAAGDALAVRCARAGLPTHASTVVATAPDAPAQLYLDAPLAELFWRGVTVTAALPGQAPFTLERG